MRKTPLSVGTKRTYPGEEDAALVLAILNGRWKEAGFLDGQERLRQIIDSAQRLESGKGRARRDAALEANALLSRYRFSWGASLNGQWTNIFEGRLDSMFWGPREANAAGAVVQLAIAGRIGRVRQCKCGKWFFARKINGRFCSDACRAKFWDSDPERKERHKGQKKILYKLHKEGRVKER